MAKQKRRKPGPRPGKSTGARKPAALRNNGPRNRGGGGKRYPAEAIQKFIMERARGSSQRATLAILKDTFRKKGPQALSTIQRWDQDYDAEIRQAKRQLVSEMSLALMEGEKQRLRTLGRAANKLLGLIETAVGEIRAEFVPVYVSALKEIVEQARLEEKGLAGGEQGSQGQGSGNLMGGIVDLARLMATDPKAAENVSALLRGVGDSILATHPDIAERTGEGPPGRDQ